MKTTNVLRRSFVGLAAVLLALAGCATGPDASAPDSAPRPRTDIAYSAADKILVYGTPTCENCRSLRRSLDSSRVAYAYYDTASDAAKNTEMYAKVEALGIAKDKITMPVVEVNGAILAYGVAAVAELKPYFGKSAPENRTCGLTALPSSGPPQDCDFQKIAAAVRGMPKAKTPQDVASFIRRASANDWEAAYGIYIWLTENVAYDADAFFTGRQALVESSQVFKVRKTVCAGYAALFRELGGLAGLETQVISGYAKGYSFFVKGEDLSVNHDWNAVKLGGAWHLVDSTWGAGYVDGVKFVKRFTRFWFDTPADIFIYWHLPEQPASALLARAPTLDEYRRMPNLENSEFEDLSDSGLEGEDILSLYRRAGMPQAYNVKAMFAAGLSREDIMQLLDAGKEPESYILTGLAEASFSPRQIKEIVLVGVDYQAVAAAGVLHKALFSSAEIYYCLKARLPSDRLNAVSSFALMGMDHAKIIAAVTGGALPRTFGMDYARFRLEDAPLASPLKSGVPVSFAMTAPGIEKAAVVCDEKWIEMKKTGERFTATVTPLSKALSLVVYMTLEGKASYWSILEYSVH